MEFEVGKWYEYNNKHGIIYAIKCSKINTHFFEYKEFIRLNDNEYKTNNFNNSLDKHSLNWTGKEIYLEDISHILPENHIDKICTNPDNPDYIQLIKLLKELQC